MTPIKWKLYAAAALLLVGAYFAWQSHQRAIGAKDALLREARAENAALRAEKRKVDSVYVRDTVTLTRVRRATDTLVLRDTLIHRDTVVKLVERERQHCDAVILTCERRVAVRDSINANLERQIKLLGKNQRRFLDRIGVYGGYGFSTGPNGTVAQGVQVGVGIRVFP